MDSFKFQDVRVEKANAIAKYRGFQRITSFFRIAEVFIFLIFVSRFSAQFAASLRFSGEYLRGVSAAALISPRSVFVVGNAIVIVLFLISRQFSGERTADFYDEYVEKCRRNSSHQNWTKSAAAAAEEVAPPQKAIGRSQSANLDRLQAVRGEERRRDLRRSVSDKCRKKAASAVVAAEEEMSGEEFRRTVEAFIARQQRSLREEENSAVVSFEA